jgi:hypothetical protein
MVAVKRIKFLSAILVFIVATLFFMRFAFYPLSSSILQVFGISYDFKQIGINRAGFINIEKFKLGIEEGLSFESDLIEISITRKFVGIFKNVFVADHLKIVNGNLNLNSKLFESEEEFELPEELPFFPLENIEIENFNVSVIENETGIIVTGLNISGNGLYKILIPEIVLFHPEIKKNISVKLEADITAIRNNYFIETINIYTDYFKISGNKNIADESLKGEITASLNNIASLFGETAQGNLFADFNLKLTGAVPEAEGNLTINGIEYEGFKPWDIHSYFRVTPSTLILNRLNLFHNKKVFLSLNSIFPFRSKKATGTVSLYRFDLDDTLNRMTTSGIVNLIVSGKADYVFNLETLAADFNVDLIANELDVDNKEILNLPREVFVTGKCTVSPDGVKLHNAVAKTKNETSRVIIKESFFGFADTMKFHIPVVEGSWINLEDVGHIAGFPVKGSGSVKALVTAFYEEPVITGTFSGSSCHFDGFNAEFCELDADMRNFLLSLNVKKIRQESLTAKGAVIDLDFDPAPITVKFSASDISGSIKDAAKIFGIDATGIGGTVNLNFDGFYSDEMEKLSGSMKLLNIDYESEKIADSISLNLVNHDKTKIKLKDSGIKYGETEIAIEGEIDKADLAVDIKASLTNFVKDNFDYLNDTSLENPFIEVNLSGTLMSPDFESEISADNIIFNDVKLGDLKLNSAYAGESGFFETAGKLGEKISFSMNMENFDYKTLSANLKTKDFTHRESDFFIIVSMDAVIDKLNTEILFSKLMFEQSGFFIRNTTPFKVSGTVDDLEIEKVFFDGETVNFSAEGSIKDYKPVLNAKGTLFPRMIDMIYPAGFTGIDGRAYFDITYEENKLFGDINVSEISYRLKDPQIVFKDLNGKISFDDKNWQIKNLKGFAGSGQLEISGQGKLFPFDEASLNIEVTNLTGRHSLAGDFGLSASLKVLLLEGENFSLSGDIDLRNIIFNQPLSIDSELFKLIDTLSKEDAVKKDAKNPVSLDLRVTGRNNLRVRTNLLTADIVFDAAISGTSEKPDLTGNLTLRNGTIQYKQNDFSIQRGMVTFEDGGGIKPYVDIESSTNITTRTGEDERDFRLIMYVNGYVMEDDLKITLDSIPQLEQQQLYSLLLWGNIGDTYSGDLAIAAITDIMGITAEVRKSFGLTRFELTPRYSEIDDKTILKLIAEKEIYENLFLTLESNPADTSDQIVELKYRTRKLEAAVGWKNKDKLESVFGAIGFDLRLDYVFE